MLLSSMDYSDTFFPHRVKFEFLWDYQTNNKFKGRGFESAKKYFLLYVPFPFYH